MKISVYFLCLFLLELPLFSQKNFGGIILDTDTKQGIPFAAIGIAGTNKGCLSDQSGHFTLQITQLTDHDSLKISSIGYEPKSVSITAFKNNPAQTIYLKALSYRLAEVMVKSQNTGYKILGTSKYSKDICTAFIGSDHNWRGEQAAIQANYKEKETVFLESFHFYIIKNEYTDSLQFRIMLYKVDEKGYPGETFLRKPILFKTNTKLGEVQIDLSVYEISTKEDFFISLECLEEKMESGKFCFAGSVKVPSFVKMSAFEKWQRVRGGGGDFNVKVSYPK